MGQKAVLVTPDGKRMLPEDDGFFATLGGDTPGCPVDFALRHLGFIKLRVIEGEVAIIELSPAIVCRHALRAVERWVAESASRLFSIKYLDRANWQSQAALSPEEAVAKLHALRSPAAAASSGRFRVEPQDFAKLLRERDHPLGPLGQKWGASSGEFDATVSAFASQDAVLPWLMIVGVPRRGPDPVFRFIGEKLFPWLPRGYQRQAVGEKLENFPDKAYGAWMSGFYKAVALSGEPRFDRVSAQVDVDGGGKRTYAACYERLMLPWRSSAKETLVSLIVRRVENAAPAPSR